VELGWIGRLDETGAQRHILLAAPERTPARPLVDRLLLVESAWSMPFRHAAGVDTMSLAALLTPVH
jgi:hypothetical protein